MMHKAKTFSPLIENVRQLSKQSRAGDSLARKTLLDTLSTISNENIIPVARAFSHFLNLTNIAEQYQTVSANIKIYNPLTVH